MFLQNPGLSVGYLKGQFLLHLTWDADKIGIVWWGQLRTKEKGGQLAVSEVLRISRQAD